jgi:hypothetical protein
MAASRLETISLRFALVTRNVGAATVSEANGNPISSGIAAEKATKSPESRIA